MVDTLRLTVTGMTCGGCENAVKRALIKLDGVQEVSASHVESSVIVLRDPDRVGIETIRKRIEALGYQVRQAPA